LIEQHGLFRMCVEVHLILQIRGVKSPCIMPYHRDRQNQWQLFLMILMNHIRKLFTVILVKLIRHISGHMVKRVGVIPTGRRSFYDGHEVSKVNLPICSMVS